MNNEKITLENHAGWLFHAAAFWGLSLLVLLTYKLIFGRIEAFFLVSLITINLALSIKIKSRAFAISSVIASCIYFVTIAYILNYFYYFDAFNYLLFASSAIAICYSYRTRNAYMAFAGLLLIENASINLYLEIADINFGYHVIAKTNSAHYIPLFFALLTIPAIIHRFRNEFSFSNACLLVYIIESAFFIFAIKMEFTIFSAAVLITGFMLCFIIYFWPETAAELKSPDDKLTPDSRFNKKENHDLSAVIANLTLLFIISACLIYSSAAMSGADYHIEFYSHGAALYYDSVLGYFARFNAAFENLTMSEKQYDALRPEIRQYAQMTFTPQYRLIETSNDAQKYIRAFVTEGSAQNGPKKNVALDFLFLNARLDDESVFSISPRFVYKLKVGVFKNGRAYLESFTRSGDRFLMFDEQNPYNKFKTTAKNFFAVSNNEQSAAVYDFSGNVRIVDLGSEKNILLVCEVKSFISIRAMEAESYLILSQDCLYKVSVMNKNIAKIALAKNGESFRDMFYSDKKILLISDKTCQMSYDGGNAFVPIEASFSESDYCLFFKGDLSVSRDYFAEKIHVKNILPGKKDDNLYLPETLSRRAQIIKALIAEQKNGERRLKIAKYVPESGSLSFFSGPLSFKLQSFDTFELSLEKNYVIDDVELNEFSDNFIAVILTPSDAELLKNGFFFTTPEKLNLKREYVYSVMPKTPSKAICAAKYTYILFDGAIHIINGKNGTILKTIECAK